MSYEVKIDQLSEGRIILTTKYRAWESNKGYARSHMEENSYTFPSVAELRKSLIREKFHSEVARMDGTAIASTGVYLFLHIGVSNNIFTNLNKGIPISGLTTLVLASTGFLMWGGMILREKGDSAKYKTDQKINEFNKTFPELKPVTFSPRDYLSTFKLPFKH